MIGLDDAGAGGHEIDERTRLREHLEHLAGGRRDEQIEPRRHALRLEEHCRCQHVAQSRSRVAAEDDLGDRLAREITHRPHDTVFVENEGIDGGEIDRDDLFTRRTRVGNDRAVGLGATLIAEEHLGLFVAHEEGRCRPELRGDAGENGSLGHREKACAGPGELEHHRGLVLFVDALDDLVDASAHQLEGHVARTNEGPHTPGEMDLHAPRRTQPDRAGGERLPEQGRGDDEAEHAHATDRGEARVVGEREPGRSREPLEMDRPGKADSGPGDGHRIGGELGGHAGRASLVDLPQRRPVGDARAVVSNRHLDGRLLQTEGERFGERARRSPRKDDLVDLDLNEVAAQLRVGGPSGENFLRHRAGRVPSSCAHRFSTLCR